MTASNRVAIITGASRGLGAVIARVLAERTYDLVIGARHPEPLQEVADALALLPPFVAARTDVIEVRDVQIP